MGYRIVRIVYPGGFRSRVKICKRLVPAREYESIYDTVDFFKKNLFHSMKSSIFISKPVSDVIPLRNIINLHDHNGIKSINRIRSMISHIIRGGHIFSRNGMPNIKLTRDADGAWILFDGHHSVLAYMMTGKEFLHEVPHVVVENADPDFATGSEISAFFGAHAKELKNDLGGWRKYTINWQAAFKNQLCERIQSNMGELADAVFGLVSNGYINQKLE